MESREVLTLQFGHYANFVGTHWWNLQEGSFEYAASSPSDINHDILYREGLTCDRKVTFTPRLLLVDLKGSLNTLPEKGDLYEPISGTSKTDVEWDEDLVEIQKAPKNNKNAFLKQLEDLEKCQTVSNQSYKLDKEVSVWSDYLYARFHPRTVNIVNEYQHCNENTPFDVYPLGASLWRSVQFEDEFCDKIRNYVEECNSFQGFHILTDCTNAFSGLSSSCLEYLQDEYDRKSVLVFPVIPAHFSDNNFSTDEEKLQSTMNDSVRLLNLALSFNSFGQKSSLFIPLSTGSKGWRQPGSRREFYHTVYDHEVPYHTSAILAAALETFTLKHRLKASNFSLADLCADMNLYGRKAAAASVCLPFSFNADSDLLECLDRWEGPLSQCITPSCTLGTDKLMQHITLRGIGEDRLKQPLQKAQKQHDLPAYRCNSIQEMLSMYLNYSTQATASIVTILQKPLGVKTPFPRIFDKSINRNGHVSAVPRPDDVNVESVPILVGLHNGAGVGDMLECLHTEARKVKFARFPQFVGGGVEKDEFEECLDSLFSLRENYEENYLI